MKTVEVEVKMRKDGKQVVVDTANIDVFETMDELTEGFTALEILAFSNAQNRANITNKLRASHREKTAGKGKRYEIAFNIVMDAEFRFKDGQTGQEALNACVASGDAKAAFDKLLALPEVQSAVDARIAEGGGAEEAVEAVETTEE